MNDKNIVYEEGDIIIFKDRPQTHGSYGSYFGLTVKEIEERENREVLEIKRIVITRKRIYKCEKEKNETDK